MLGMCLRVWRGGLGNTRDDTANMSGIAEEADWNECNVMIYEDAEDDIAIAVTEVIASYFAKEGGVQTGEGR